jgi:xeroderma pigmentosum group C-complementing protein
MPERRQSRIEESYIKQLMYRPPVRANVLRSVLEDQLIFAKLLSMDLPRSKGNYKNHLLYALDDQLKVKEALYPPDAEPIAEHNIFPVYSRLNVGTLDIDLRWRRKGYQVKEGEEPYKLIAGRARGKKEPPQQKLFGPWQLERCPAPELEEDGSIPVNANGNVYLYKSWMTPKNCFHLKVFGHGEEIAKLAKVENVQAIVAWTFKKAKYFPV